MSLSYEIPAILIFDCDNQFFKFFFLVTAYQCSPDDSDVCIMILCTNDFFLQTVVFVSVIHDRISSCTMFLSLPCD